jgi:N-terminal acetyltransferase B complex non-catalytic subunit
LLAEIQWTIVECQHGLQQYNHIAGPKLAGYWKYALDNAKGPNVLKSRKEFFQAAWRDEYWDLIQQLFARLQKEYPNNPQYHFAWIAFSQLQADTMSPDDRMAQSLKLLAFRSLKAAFDNTLNSKETGKKITSSHQLRLAVQIYKKQQQYDDLLTILRDPQVGISSIGMKDGEFVFAEIELLLEKKSFDEVFGLCQPMLDTLITARENKEDATTIDTASGADDWFVWKSLLDSALQSSQPEHREKAQFIIERFLKLEPANRNAGRALLSVQAKQKTGVLETCLRFFDSHSSKPSCFGDLRDFLPRLSHHEQGSFLAHIDEAAKSRNPFVDTEGYEPKPEESLRWVNVNINALKFEYFLCVSKVPLPEKEALENFVSDALRMYKLALSVNKECGEEACILAVIGLVKLNHFARDFDLDDGPMSGTPTKSPGKPFSPKSYLIQALYLLEFLRFNNKHNYSALLLATTISQTLGLTALAATAINVLKLKEFQYDTASHLFWSRISINHPHNCKEDMVRRLSNLKISNGAVNSAMSPYAHPTNGLDTALYWYDAASDRMGNTLDKLFETIPFDKVLEFSQFKQKFQNSFTRALLTLESRRVYRILNNQTTPEPLPTVFGNWTNDNRDFDTIPNFEYPTTDKFSTFVTTRPSPMVSAAKKKYDRESNHNLAILACSTYCK